MTIDVNYELGERIRELEATNAALVEALEDFIHHLENGGGYSDDDELWNNSCDKARAALNLAKKG